MIKCALQRGDTLQIEFEFENYVAFWVDGKTAVPREKPSKNESQQQTQPTLMTPSPGIEPGPHWWEASALSAVPSLLLSSSDI